MEIEVGQCWTHKLTSMKFSVVLVDGNEILLEPEGDGQELTLSKELLFQEFRCPAMRRARVAAGGGKKKKRIKPGKIRRGLRR